MLQVLLVDDEPELAGIAKHFLESRKLMQVTCVESAEEALDLLGHREFQAIVSDYQMPNMNGIQFLKALRSRGSRIPFILFTGKGREEVVIEALNSGADFYLQKGGDPRSQYAELGHKLRAAVAKYAAETEVRDQRARLEALIDSSDRAIFSVDANYRYTAFNSFHKDVMKALYGVDIEIGKSILEYQTVEVDRKKAKANLDRALSGQRHADSAFSGEDPRTRQEFLVSHTPIRASDGAIVGVVVYADRVTDLSRVNEELEETRRRFDTLFAAYNEGVALHELVYRDGKAVDYRIMEVNRAYEDIIGVSRDAVLGKLASALYGAGAAPYLDRYAKVVEDGVPVRFETYFPPLEKYLSISVFTPAPGQFATVFMDVTKRKIVEEELRQSHEMIEGIMNSLPVRVFWKDASLKYLGCNSIFAHDAGYEKPAELVGKDDYVMAWRDQAEMYRADDMAVISSARPKLLIEEPQTRPDGGKVTLLTSKIPLLSSNGEIRGVLGTYMDITDYKNAELALRESEEVHRQMLDHAGIGIGYYDLDGTVIMFNALAAKHMNGAPADFKGRTIFELFGQEYGQFYFDRIVKAAQEEGPTECEDLVHLPTGDKWFLSLHKRVLDRDGNVIGVQIFSHDITRRKKAEEALRESEEKYRILLHESKDPTFSFYPDGTYRYVNRAFAEGVGMRAEDIVGKKIWDVFPPEEAEKRYSALRSVFATGIGREIEVRVPKPEGDHYYLTSITPIKDEAGTAISVICSSREFTERKRAETRLKETKEYLQNLLDYANAPIIVWSPDFVVTIFNHAFERLTGMNALDVLGRHLDILFPEETKRQSMDLIQRATSGDRWEVVEIPIQTETGEVRTVLWNSAALTSETGEVKATIAQGQDITERKVAEKNLLQSEFRYRSVTENANEGIVVAQNGILRYCNPRTLDMIGLTAAEAIDSHFIDFIHPDDRKMVGERYERRIHGEEVPSRYDFRVISREKKVTWVSLSVVSIQWDDKPATLNFLVDISERKRAEQELTQANRRLNLLGSITRHDAMNQAMIIEGNADLLAAGALDESQRAKVLKVKRSADAIQRQMQFAKLYQEIGAQAPAWQGVQESVQKAKVSIPLGELDVRLEGQDHLILADPMFEKVVYNLIDNCVRHSGGAKCLTVTSKVLDGRLILSFADDGQGVSPDDKERLFERGFGKNTGYGLFLSREILGITGITIVENGREGSGARFELTVPEGDWRLK